MNTDDQVVLDCGCRFPGEPCPELRRLQDEQRRAYNEVLEAGDEAEEAQGHYAQVAAANRLRRAQARHEELGTQIRAHRTSTDRETPRREREPGRGAGGGREPEGPAPHTMEGTGAELASQPLPA